MKKTLVIAIAATSLFACGSKKKPSDSSGSGSAAAAVGSGSASAEAGSATSAAGSTGPGAALWTDKPDPLQQAVVEAMAEKLVGSAKKDSSLVGQIIDATAAAHAAVSRDAWDPAAVVATVGKDRVALYKWVRDNTALVPYRGSLRGSVGVMMDRVGNSLDRSLLLANLLTQAGLEVRLANAQLDPALVAKLVEAGKTRARPVLSTAHIDDAALTATVAKIAGLDAKTADASNAKVKAAAEALAGRTKSRVDSETKALAALVPPGAAVTADSAYTDHWWVQVHDGDAWSNLDTALPAAAPGESLAVDATETLAPGDLADDRLHMIDIRVIGEVWHGATREEPVLLEQAIAPSKFFGQRILISNVALDFPEPKDLAAAKDPVDVAKKALLAANEYVPVVTVGAHPVTHMSVNDRGELMDMTAGDGNTIRLARGIQHATKDGVGGATGMLDQLPDTTGGSSSAPPVAAAAPTEAFTAEWIEFEIRTPGAPPKVIRRTVFDTLGLPAGADRNTGHPVALNEAGKLDRALALNAEIELLPMFAQIPQAFVVDRTVQSLVASREVLVTLAAGKKLDAMWPKLKDLTPIPSSIYAFAVARFADQSIYLDRLDLVAVRKRVIARDKTLVVRRETDILSNSVAVWPTVKDPRTARISQGIRDTDLEMLANPCSNCSRSPSTAEQFDGAKDWAVAASPTGMAAIDRAAGYTVVAPKGGSSSTWWRIDPTTGETLGMNPLGGDEGVEYNILVSMMDNGIGSIANIIGCVGIARASAAPLDSEENHTAMCMFSVGVGFGLGVAGGAMAPGAGRALAFAAQIITGAINYNL